MSSKYRRLAIVGGGASGVAAFIAAVKYRTAESICIIDPRPIGRGMVYSAQDDEFICNSSIASTNIDNDDYLDFLKYLDNCGHKYSENAYVPRRLVGDYIIDRFNHYYNEARSAGIDVVHIMDSCESVMINSARNYKLILSSQSDWRTVTATDIALCTGHGPSKVPGPFEPYLHHETFIRSPYPEDDMLARLPAGSEVLIIGTKQSAIDAALVLCRAGHRVTMTSPSGELPAVRSRLVRSEKFAINQETLRQLMSQWDPHQSQSDSRDLEHRYWNYISHTLLQSSGVPLGRQFSCASKPDDRLRQEIAIAERGDCHWQDAVLSFVDTVNSIYLSTPDDFRGGFDPRVLRRMSRYIAAAALPNAKKVLNYIEKRSLGIEKGDIKEVWASNADKAWKVKWDGKQRWFDAVVCATGFHDARYAFDATGALVIGNEADQRGNRAQITHDLAVRHPVTKEKESIWAIGSGTNHRILTASALSLTVPQADQAARSMSNLSM